MKRITLLLLVTVVSLALYAQSAKSEAISSLNTAKSMIESGKYIKAQEELDYAQAKISEILSEDLLKYIPAAPAGFTLEDKTSQSLGQAGAIIGSANAIAATGTYTKDEIELDLTIAVGGLPGQTGGLMGLAAMFGGMTDMRTRTIRIKGNNATLEYDEDEESGTLTIKVGENITVLVSGENLTDADVMKTLAEKVDFDGLLKNF
ncbi:MAG: hypothetical protein RBR69_00115 [Candidatus Cloacimonadaceae bacterium]|jgi:hypothetical protein|nr:hypothetical protein [Candidatus Cloacimonadota bacterium]MCK9243471.1 hypothetical protein [Candidatus Cloacimonadota bacterium]MDD3533047.1 hypothetical protein [Candidatus Cloacimonadota bacterium]MDY0126527.1 hypothetical protein [Candidatus Cloacimonadaceae bacterium]